jgi:uncharacterized protein (UPF0371 family)
MLTRKENSMSDFECRNFCKKLAFHTAPTLLGIKCASLIALSSSCYTNENAVKALKELPKLKNAEFHSTILLPHIDAKMMRKLGINLTSCPVYEDKIPKYEI